MRVLFQNQWHGQGFDEGLEQGLAQGLEKGREENKARALRVVERNWRRRFGSELPSRIQSLVTRLNAAWLDELGDVILDFTHPPAPGAGCPDNQAKPFRETEMETVAPESKEKKFLFWTHWHDRGFDEGLEQGLEKGLEKGRAENKLRALRVVERNWRRRFGSELPSGIQSRVAGLDAEWLDQLSDAILDFSQPPDADTWLSTQPG